MFAAEFEPAVIDERRRAPRAPVSLDARLGRGGFDRALCKVVDISLHGARLHTYTALRKGQVIWLTLPRLGQVAATVIWADELVAGCAFEHPLGDADYAALAKY